MTVTEKKYLICENGINDRSLHGAFSSSDVVRFDLEISGCSDIKSVIMEIHRDGCEDSIIKFERADGGIFRREIGMNELCGADKSALFWYRYKILLCTGDALLFGGERPKVLEPCDASGDRQLLVYSDSFSVPEWIKGCVIYHIFVDRFRRGDVHPAKPGAVYVSDWNSEIPEYPEHPGDPIKNNSFFGGDLKGVEDALPYLESMGVDLIYLSPVFESPSNHRYDTADYMAVDSAVGGDAALVSLISAAKKRGIRIMLDGVFNHTGCDSVYFNKFGTYPPIGACDSKNSPYYEWYNFKKWPDDYECWWGIKILPRVDSECRSWQNFIFGSNGVTKRCIEMGAAGFRLDVCDELSDSFLEGLSRSIRIDSPEAVLIGEVWEDATNKVAYGRRRKYLRGEQLDSVMNYPFRDAVISFVKYGDFEKFQSITEGLFRRYPEASAHSAMNVLGTHDTVRLITALAGPDGDDLPGSSLAQMHLTESERELGIQMAIFAFALMCALPGALCLFYGDETGVEGYRDPFCRRTYPWGREDMHMIGKFRNIAMLRRTHEPLRTGEFEITHIDSIHAVIRRYTKKSNITAYFSRSDIPITIEVPEKGQIILSNGTAKGNTILLTKFGYAFISDVRQGEPLYETSENSERNP